MRPVTSGALVTVRIVLRDEISRLLGQAEALQVVLDAVEGILGEPPEAPTSVAVVAAAVEAAAAPKLPASKRAHAPYDWDEVAAVCAAARKAGKPLSRALVERYDVSKSMASWMAQQVRKRAADAPAPTASASPDSNGETLAVAHAEGLIANGHEPGKGADDVYPSARPMMTAGRDKVLACDDEGCEFTCRPDHLPDLRAHVQTEHGRRLTDGERTPVLA